MGLATGRGVRTRVVALVIALGVACSACGSSGGSQGSGSGAPKSVTITLLTHDSWAASTSVIAAFTAQTGINVKILKEGDAGAELNQAILTKSHPLADAIYGTDNTLLSRAITSGILEPWTAPELAHVPAEFQLDPTHHLTPVDYGDVCLNYDKAWFAAHHLDPPTKLADLTQPAYRSLTVVENPLTSSTGLAFLLATVARYGDPGWHDYWTRLKANGVLVQPGWEQAYDGSFTAGGGNGNRPIVVSYASSPPADVVFSDPKKTEPTVGVVDDGCFRQVEFAGILKGTGHRAQAGELVDFLLSLRFQQDMPLQMYVFPVRSDAKLPEVFQKWVVPVHPLTLAPATISAHRDDWTREWNQLVVH